MAFFGSAPSRAAAPSFTPPPAKPTHPLFEEAPQTNSNPLFGDAPSTSSGPFFGQAPATGSTPFFGEAEWLTVTFAEENLDTLFEKGLWLELFGIGDILDGDLPEDLGLPAGAPPFLLLASFGGEPLDMFSGPEGEESPWRAGIETLRGQVDGELGTASLLLLGFAATGETQTVTFDWLFDTLPEELGASSSSVAFYLTPHGDAGVLNDPDSAAEQEPDWLTESVVLEGMTDPFLGEELMALMIGVADISDTALPSVLLLDNITLVGVPEDGLAELPLLVD